MSSNLHALQTGLSFATQSKQCRAGVSTFNLGTYRDALEWWLFNHTQGDDQLSDADVGKSFSDEVCILGIQVSVLVQTIRISFSSYHKVLTSQHRGHQAHTFQWLAPDDTTHLITYGKC